MRLVGLKHVAATECTEDTENRKQDSEEATAGQSALGETLGQVIHRTTRDGTVCVLVTIFDAERTLGELGGHAHQARHNHPEGSTRTTNADGHRYTGNVTETNGTGKRCRQCLEVTDFTRVIRIRVITFNNGYGELESTELDEGEVKGKYRCRYHQPGHNPWKRGAWERTENKVHEPAGCRGKKAIDHLVNRARQSLPR